MFASKFLNNSANVDAVALNRRSMLFAARAAMRCIPVSEPPYISPLTAALVSVAENRTPCPEVPTTSDLVTAEVESGAEAQDVVLAVRKVKKSGRKRKNEVQDGTVRKKSGGTRKRKAEPNAAIA